MEFVEMNLDQVRKSILKISFYQTIIWIKMHNRGAGGTGNFGKLYIVHHTRLPSQCKTIWTGWTVHYFQAIKDRSKRMNFDQISYITYQLSCGIKFLQTLGILHRVTF